MFVNFNILNQLGSPAINSNTFANRPAAGQTGRLFVSTDTFEIYRDNGTSWDLIGGPGSSTITGSGTATQVAYFTGTNAIGSSANLFWDNTNGYLGVNTATPGAAIEAKKTDGYGIYSNYTTSAGSGTTATALWALNTTATGSGYAGVIEEKSTNTTGGQYPLVVKHSLSSGTAAAGMGTGLHFQLPDDAGTFKTTQLTIETTNAAAAAYATRYRFNVQSAGSSTAVAYLNATGLGLFTATPGAPLDVHGTGTNVQINSTGATNNNYLTFQRTGTTTFSIGDTYNGGTNYFRIFGQTLGADIAQIFAATGKTIWQATQTYTTGLARGNYFAYNLTAAAGTTFSSPNTIEALGATLNLSLGGNATIPSGARSGLDAYNTVSFTGSGTLTQSQGTQIRAYSNLTTGWAFAGTATGTITHLAGLRVLFPDNSGSAVTITNNYGLLINDQTANTGTVTYTNRWGIYQEGASDTNYFNGTTLIGTTVNSGYKLDVVGDIRTLDSSFIVTGTGGYVGNGLNVSVARGDTTAYNLINVQNTLGTAKFIVRGDGNVGIGTTTPQRKLQVTTSMMLSSGSTAQEFLIGDDNVRYFALQTPSGAANLQFNLYGGSNIMTMTSAANVLIGTTTDAGQKLQVNGAGLFSTTNTTGSTILLTLSRNTGGYGYTQFQQSYDSTFYANGKTLTLINDSATSFAHFAGNNAGTVTDLIIPTGAVKTAAPSGGTAAAWKLGSRVAATVTLSTSQYIEVDIGGTLYKLAIVT
jgi:hypothetical protein